jgi:NADH dehydrogenase FAD-containing subunit
MSEVEKAAEAWVKEKATFHDFEKQRTYNESFIDGAKWLLEKANERSFVICGGGYSGVEIEYLEGLFK